MDKHLNLEQAILASSWWAAAERCADRHQLAESGATVSDHLLSVHKMVRLLLLDAVVDPYVDRLRRRLDGMGIVLDKRNLGKDLRIVALLHDIGKPLENKLETVAHPLTGKRVARRHPVVGAGAALELLPETCGRRSLIASLVSKHGTGWSWYRQWESTGQLPSKKGWCRLDRSLPAGREGLGVFYLAFFKLADVDGHANLRDVPWFLERANEGLLDDLGLSIPVPSLEAIGRLRSIGLGDGDHGSARHLD